jgi:hypothetical protein
MSDQSKASQALDQHLTASIGQLSGNPETNTVIEPTIIAAPSQPPTPSIQTVKAPSTGTPALNSLQDTFSRFTARVDRAAAKLAARMDSVASFTETAVEKFGGAIDKVEAQAKAIDDAANQMTNGGPPLGN